MHCGAPVVAGNNSSQIEVVGDAGLLFNVADAGELAAQLVRVLDDPGRSREMRERAVVQARRFRWEETADKTLEVLTRSHAPRADGPPALPGADAPRGAGSPSSRPCPRCDPRSRTTRRGCWTS